MGEKRRIVFMQILDGTPDEYQSLIRALLPVAKVHNVDFVAGKKELSSFTAEELKKLLERVIAANDNKTMDRKSG